MLLHCSPARVANPSHIALLPWLLSINWDVCLCACLQAGCNGNIQPDRGTQRLGMHVDLPLSGADLKGVGVLLCGAVAAAEADVDIGTKKRRAEGHAAAGDTVVASQSSKKNKKVGRAWLCDDKRCSKPLLTHYLVLFACEAEGEQRQEVDC